MAARPTAPAPYTPGDIPNGEDLHPVLTDELRKIAGAMTSVGRMTPQAATAAPKTLVDGMVRMARAPWRPAAGQTVDEWVFYEASSGTWKRYVTRQNVTGSRAAGVALTNLLTALAASGIITDSTTA